MTFNQSIRNILSENKRSQFYSDEYHKLHPDDIMYSYNTIEDTKFYKKFIAAKHKLFQLNPFIYNTLVKMEIKVTKSQKITPIAAVDISGTSLYLNIETMKNYSIDVIVAILAHEMLHIIWFKNDNSKMPDSWLRNIAEDMIINRELCRVGFKTAELMKNYISIWSKDNIYTFQPLLPSSKPNEDQSISLEYNFGKKFILDANKKTAIQIYKELEIYKLSKGSYIFRDGKPYEMRTFINI